MWNQWILIFLENMTFLDIDIEPRVLYRRVEEILDPSEAQL